MDAPLTTPEMQSAAPLWTRYTNIPFRLLGYGILMGWHFLLIYFYGAPLGENTSASMLLLRQIALNASLVAAFATFALLGRKGRFPVSKFPLNLIIGVSLCAAAATAGTLLATAEGHEALVIVSTIFTGATEAMLLIAWLHYYSESSDNYAKLYIALSLIIGALVAFFIDHLTFRLGLACFIALPVISAIMLASSVHQTPVRDAESGSRGLPDQAGALQPLWSSTLFLVVYGAVFGFLQGSAAASETGAVFTVFSPVTVVGAGVAGALAVLIHHRLPARRSTEVLRRCALMLFVVGVMLTAFPFPILKECASTFVMMGFITADITVLVFVIHIIRAYDVNSFFAIGLNRAGEYGAFAIAIVFGAWLSSAFGTSEHYPLTICAIAIVVILAYTLIEMSEGKLDWVHQAYRDEKSHKHEDDETIETAAEPICPEGRWKTRCRIISEQAGLSPRECEVFALMARGRNAEYIQGALVISGYTAKTHIANIYRKTGVHSLQELIDAVEAVDQETIDQYTASSGL